MEYGIERVERENGYDKKNFLGMFMGLKSGLDLVVNDIKPF